MSTTIVRNRITQQASDQKLIDGLTKHAATITSLVIGGQTLKTADIITILQSRLAASNAAQATRAAWMSAVRTDADELAKTKTFTSGLRQALGVAFAGSIDLLADFGLTPRKRAVVSPEKRVAATAKAQATRAARHTVGKKAKLAIKGAVPPTTPASPPALANPPAGVVPPPGPAASTAPTSAVTAALSVGAASTGAVAHSQ